MIVIEHRSNLFDNYRHFSLRLEAIFVQWAKKKGDACKKNIKKSNSKYCPKPMYFDMNSIS